VLREICDETGIDHSHFRQVGPDDASILRVVPAARSWPEALQQLGYAPDSSSARATIRKHCQRLGTTWSSTFETLAFAVCRSRPARSGPVTHGS
jgi:hypothetical protein